VDKFHEKKKFIDFGIQYANKNFVREKSIKIMKWIKPLCVISKPANFCFKAFVMNDFEKLATNSVYLWQRYHWK